MRISIICIAFISLLFSCNRKNPNEHLYEVGMKEINGTNIYYKVIGSSEPILIIHGGPGLSHDYFLPALDILKKQYKLIFYDQRGCGKSDLTVDSESISLDNFVRDIDEIRLAFGIEKINVMAHSWGGILAMKYAISYPNNVKSLILINSVGASSAINALSNAELINRFTPEDSVLRSQIFNSEEFKKRSPSSIESLMKLNFKHQFYNQTYLDSLNLSINENYLTTSQLLQNLGNDLASFDFHSELKNIKCPTLLIYGSHDPLTKVAGTRLNELISNSKIEILDECGHFPFIEKPTRFKEMVTQFIQ